MRKHLYFITIIVIMIIAIISQILVTYSSVTHADANNGVLDIQNESMSKSITLNGQWEIYKDMLIGTDNIDVSSTIKSYVNLPTNDFKAFKKFGYVSYRMIIENVTPGEYYNIALDEVNGGYAVYMNKELIITNHKINKGTISVNLDTPTEQYQASSSTIEIIVEVSNYESNFTGLKNAPIFSTRKMFNRDFLLDLVFKVILIGGLIFAIIYHFIVVGIRNKNLSAVFFALSCFALMLSLVTYKSTYSYVINKTYNIYDIYNYYINFICLYLSSIFLYFNIRSLSKDTRRFFYDYSVLFLSLIVVVIPLFISLRNFLNLIFIFNSINTLILFFTFYQSIKSYKKNKLMMYLSISLIILVIASVYDTLIHYNLIFFNKSIYYIVFFISTFTFTSISSTNYEQELSNVNELILLNEKIRDTEFTFLNSQIQSHFIYNTLNSIQSLCYTNPTKAGELIEDFSMYLRTRLEFNKMPILIAFEDELENIRTYINIEKQRFGKRINVSYNLLVGEFKVPPLTIQPLVENAIKHGISKKREGGTIIITTQEDHNYIYVSIADNGVGFDLKNLPEKQRVGTQNIKHRLHLHLNATLEITSQVNEGSIATIKIPKK